jgi:hypothetical protein
MRVAEYLFRGEIRGGDFLVLIAHAPIEDQSSSSFWSWMKTITQTQMNSEETDRGNIVNHIVPSFT